MRDETNDIERDAADVALAWAAHTIPKGQSVPPELLDYAAQASAALTRVENRLVSMGIVGAAGAGELLVAHFGEDFFRENVLPDLKSMCGEIDPHPYDRGRVLAYVNGVGFDFYTRPRRETISIPRSRAADPLTLKSKE